MANLEELVGDLEQLRSIPQLLFSDTIWYQSTTKLRETLIERRKTNPDEKEIDFILNSPGGAPADAYRMIRALRATYKTVNVIVPFWAKSAATLLSLGASNLIVDDWAEFGPIDTQVAKEKEDSPGFEFESALNDEFSLELIEGRAQELFKKMFIDFHGSENIPISKNDLSCHLMEYVPKFYRPLVEQLNPFKLGEKKRQLDISVKYAQRILIQYSPKMSDQQRKDLIDYLLNECPEHGYIVDYAILSVFLPNIRLASTVGDKYAKKLEELSVHFMSNEETHIGFISGAKPAPAKEAEKILVEEDFNGQTDTPDSKPAEVTNPTNIHASSRIGK